MNKLERLIKELCPNGVEYAELGRYCKLKAGKAISAIKITAETDETHIYPCYGGNGLRGYVENYNHNGVYSLIGRQGALCGNVCYVNGLFYATEHAVVVSAQEEYNTRFLYYLLENADLNQYKTAGAQPGLSVAILEKILLPVPPLEVQAEIVKVLDEYTESVTALKQELEKELAARKKQYEYYRDSLLSFNEGECEWKTLGEIAIDIYRGSGIKRDEVTETGIPCVRYGEIYTQYNTWFKKALSHTQLQYIQSPKYFEYGDVLFAITGESVEDIAKSVVYLGNEKCLAGGDIVVLKHEQNPRYMAHVLLTQSAREQKSKGKVKSKVVHSSVPSIKEIRIPIPSLDIQEQIANILDRFDKLCNDISDGLPAEIEARRKQYEYYRDKLLSFKEA